MTDQGIVSSARLHFECAPSRSTPDEWVVEAIDHVSEGEIYAAIFSGPGAKERAEEYAAWKNGTAAPVPAPPNPQAHMVEVSGPAGDPIWVDQRALDFNAHAALAGIDPKGQPR